MVIPELLLNGEVQVTSETGEGMSVVYNYPNCTGTVVGPDASEFGHVVAPKALIKITVGNYSGTMVGNNVYLGGRAEGHLYPYRGEILIGFYGDLEFNKKVNNATPTDLQKYTFALVRLNNAIKKTEDNSKFWEELQTTKNEGGTFTFTDVHFSRQGDYYFKVYEKPSTQEGVTIDNKEYLIKVSVGATTTSDGKVVYSIDSAKYYTIDDADNLLTITEGEEYKNAKVNEDAITESRSITWNQGSSDENVKMTGDLTFFNTVADASVTLDGTKTLEGQDLTDEQFSFKVKDTTEKSPHKGEEVATGTNNAQGAITFTSITYDSDMFEGDDYVIQTDAETGDKYIELTYSVEEVKPDEATAGNNYTVDGIKYDPSVKTVTVKVTAHIDGGNITAEVTSGGDSISFRNTAEEEKGYLKVKKTVSGATLEEAKTFKFTVKGPDNKYYYLENGRSHKGIGYGSVCGGRGGGRPDDGRERSAQRGTRKLHSDGSKGRRKRGDRDRRLYGRERNGSRHSSRCEHHYGDKPCGSDRNEHLRGREGLPESEEDSERSDPGRSQDVQVHGEGPGQQVLLP